MTRKWLGFLSVGFLIMAFYKAWEDQYEKAEAAGKSEDGDLKQTHEFQQTVIAQRNTIDKLTTDLFEATNKLSSTEIVNSNFYQPTTTGNNSTTGNYSPLVVGSPNATVTVNDLAKMAAV